MRPIAVDSWPRGPFPGVPDGAGASALAERVRRSALGSDWSKSRLDFDRIARAGRFKIVRTTLGSCPGREQGLLIPLPNDRFEICVDPTPPGGWAGIHPRLQADVSRHRFRFRVGHEVGHAVVAFERRRGAEPRAVLPPTEEEERFASNFARHLLLPAAAAARARPHVRSLCRLQARYDVSREVAARALAEAHGPSVLVGLWHWRETGGRPNPRLQWSSSRRAPRALVELAESPLRELIEATRGRSRLIEHAGASLLIDRTRQQVFAVAA